MGRRGGRGIPGFISLGAEFPPVEGDFGAFFEVVHEVFSQFAADVASIRMRLTSKFCSKLRMSILAVPTVDTRPSMTITLL